MPSDNKKTKNKLIPPPAEAFLNFEKEKNEREKRKILAELEYEARLLKAKVEIQKARNFLERSKNKRG
jgi:hypothetical protein